MEILLDGTWFRVAREDCSMVGDCFCNGDMYLLERNKFLRFVYNLMISGY